MQQMALTKPQPAQHALKATMINKVWEEEKPNLIIIRGLPGSGKSTLAHLIELYAERKIISFSADDYFMKNGEYQFDRDELSQAHHWCKSMTRLHLREGESVIAHNTFTTEWEVEAYQQLAIEENANFFSIICENRNGTENVHNVPQAVLGRMKDRFSIKL